MKLDSIQNDELEITPLSPSRARIGVLVLTYNAVSTLGNVLGRIPTAVWKDVEEIVVIDDASQDATYELGIGLKVTSGNPKLTILRNERSEGYGANQKAGYNYFITRGFDIVVLLHGDGQYPPELIGNMYQPIVEGQADAVFGSRLLRQESAAARSRMPFYKYVGIRLLSSFESVALGLSLSEFHSGYRAYNLHALSQIDLTKMTDDYHFDTEIIIKLHHQGFRIHEVPIPVYRATEIHFRNGIQYSLKVIRAVTRYKLTVRSIKRYPEFAEFFVHYPLKNSRYSSHYYFEQFVGRDHDVLDLGCGEGFFAKRIKQKNNRVVGVDMLPQPQQLDAFDAYFVADLSNGLADIKSAAGERRFDEILLQDILEHLVKPDCVLRDCHQFLNATGHIIVSVPNVANITVRLGLLFGRFTYTERGILDKTHLKFYTFKTMRRLLEDCDYEIVHQEATVMPFEIILGIGVQNRGFMLLNSVLAMFTTVLPTLMGYQCLFVARPKSRTL